MYEDELEHYGRLGMKWGQHIFGKEKAYSMSVERLKKLDTKIQKRQAKAAKYALKSAKKEEKANLALTNKSSERRKAKSLKYKRKSARQNYKVVKTTKKAKQWVNNMNEYFSDMTLDSISAEDIAIGRQYSVKAIEDFLKRNS